MKASPIRPPVIRQLGRDASQVQPWACRSDAGRSGTQQTPKILVVEDTDVAREPLVRLLQHEGYEAKGVSNGQEALQAIAADPPDLVLLDILMPVMNGLEFLHHLRDDPKFKGLPVIVLTAFPDEISEREARHLGVQGFLIKSGSMDQVLSVMRGTLEKSA